MAEERQEQQLEQQEQEVRLGWRRRLILLLFLIGIGGVLIRMKSEDAAKITPFITECALAMLIGIGLGMATRSVAKILIFFITLGFVGIQVLAYKGMLEVNWPAVNKFLKESVLIELQDADLGAIVQHKLPSFGALLIGYLFGLKRG